MKQKIFKWTTHSCLLIYIVVWMLFHPRYMLTAYQRALNFQRSYRKELQKWALNVAMKKEALAIYRRMGL